MRVVLSGLIALASFLAVPGASAREQTGEEALAGMIGDRPAAPPVDCIDPREVRSTRIVDATAIVYEIGGRLYVARPSTGASRLRRDDVLVTRINGDQLCRIDTVTLVDPATRMQHGFVILGPFAVYGPRR